MKGRFVLLIAVAASLYVASAFKFHKEPKRFCDDIAVGDTVVAVTDSEYGEFSRGDTVVVSYVSYSLVKLNSSRYYEDIERVRPVNPCISVITFWHAYFFAVSIILAIAAFGYLYATFAYDTALSKWLDKTFGI